MLFLRNVYLVGRLFIMIKSREDRLNDKSRYRKWFVKWYEDSSNTDDIVNFCNTSRNQFIYICHDSDRFTDDDVKVSDRDIKVGDLKKVHYHAWLNLKDGTTYKALSKKLGIDVIDIDVCRNDTACIEYLIHLNDSDKFQYSSDCLKGNAVDKALRIFSKHNMDENDIAMDIIDIIQSYNEHIGVTSFVKDICQHGYFSEFRRCYSLYKDLFNERMYLLSNKGYVLECETQHLLNNDVNKFKVGNI